MGAAAPARGRGRAPRGARAARAGSTDQGVPAATKTPRPGRDREPARRRPSSVAAPREHVEDLVVVGLQALARAPGREREQRAAQTSRSRERHRRDGALRPCRPGPARPRRIGAGERSNASDESTANDAAGRTGTRRAAGQVVQPCAQRRRISACVTGPRSAPRRPSFRHTSRSGPRNSRRVHLPFRRRLDG